VVQKTANIKYKNPYQFYETCKARDTYKTANIFASVIGLGHNMFLIYPRPITLETDICGFLGVIGLTCLITLARFFIFNM